MKILRNFLDKIEPNFKEGGKLEFFYPFYEAMDSFFYNVGAANTGRVHVRDCVDLKRNMILVMVALAPCILFGVYNIGEQAHLAGGVMTGWRGDIVASMGLTLADGIVAKFVYGLTWFLPIYLVIFGTGLFWEILISMIRKHEIYEGVFVTSILFPLIVPPSIPLWQVFVAMSFAIILGKEVFGGTGMNFMNPALIARAFLFFAYPAQISGDKVWTVVDGISQATPLSKFAASVGPASTSFMDAFLGRIPGCIGETSTLCCIAAGVFLVMIGVASWRIIVSCLAGMVITAFFFNILYANGICEAPMCAVNPLWHFVLGGFAFGLVFMVTDPVTGSQTDTGRWFYGGFVGAMCIVIRNLNVAYPEGMMLAILLGNIVAPLIDYFVVEANVKRRSARYA
ncbi:MAG: NADH:ubiquinone reductase (Na(+)-transporting) subunit B [Kiritimatiellae bacterium]|jgi:Na+-transporting NADH:ubiquinone oxidoreductase subunit B|nr:NADH:ubiquinone reductase (Na(+)-transporting) subunit B [Kiritimatiellia bacterium]